MLKFKSTMFTDESDLFVALHSNKARITEMTLREMAFKRGILYPKAFDKDEMINVVSDLPFSYRHIEELTNKLTPKINRDYHSVKKIKGNFDISLLLDVMTRVKKERPRTIGTELITFNKVLNIFNVDVDYTEFDFSRGKFQQKRRHGGYIQFISNSDNEVIIQFTFSKRIESILRQILNTFKYMNKAIFEVQSVDLSTILIAKDRNSFVDSIYKSDDDFTFLTVDRVRLSKIKSYFDVPPAKENLHAVETAGGVSTEEEIEEENELEEQTEDNFIYKMDAANFTGQSLNDSTEIENFCKKGFYKSTVRWRAKANCLKSRPIIELEFSFDEKFLGKNIKYRIIGKQALAGEPRQEVEGADFDIVALKLKNKIFAQYELLLSEKSCDKENVLKEA